MTASIIVIDGAAEWVTAGASIALVIVATLGIIGFAIRRRRHRLDVSPYLRIDLGPNENAYLWRPPQSERTLDDRGFSISEETEASKSLWVWLRNYQTASLGHATRIWLRVEYEYASGGTEKTGSHLDMNAAYVEPGTTVAIKLLTFPLDCEDFVARVVDVEYYDLWEQKQTGWYGRLICTYDLGQFVPYPEFVPVESGWAERFFRWLGEKL